jgi:hypothetical protein
MLGKEVVENSVVLRDATGRLGFVCDREPRSEEERDSVTNAIIAALGPYARRDSAITFVSDPGARRLLQEPLRLPFQIGEVSCKLVDRRIVGSGWLDIPRQDVQGPPRVVFASLKGGVGRSTALAVAAADFARRGQNVLVIDLDLEAPGLGDLLLDEERVPRFGVVDFLVENGIGSVPPSLLDEFIGASALTTGGGGRVDVVPALGSKAIEFPENVMPKLARAMIEDILENGELISVTQQISAMIELLTERAAYDVVLIDSRAGLAELAAPAMLGLSAVVLLFGTAQIQTVNGYRALFSALRLLAKRDREQLREPNWRLKLKAVHAKATLSESVLARHRDNLYDLFAEELYDEDRGIQELADVSFGIDEPDAPHWPLVIPFNQAFIDWDPVRDPGQLTQSFYEQTFRSFLNGLDTVIQAASDPAPLRNDLA